VRLRAEGSLDIGLFGLFGIEVFCTAPSVGRHVDRLILYMDRRFNRNDKCALKQLVKTL
jgi:hypothetical protein